MKKLIALLVLLMCTGPVFAQQILPSSGYAGLDQELRAEVRRIQENFQVQAALFFFDDEGEPNALAIPRAVRRGTNGTVLMGVSLVRQTLANSEQRGDALVGILAHEMGHIVQFAHNLDFLSVTERERQADFLAGYYIAHENARGRDIDLLRVADCMFSVGGGSHGSPRQRAAIMLHGYRQGHLPFDQALARSIDLIRRGAYHRLP